MPSRYASARRKRRVRGRGQRWNRLRRARRLVVPRGDVVIAQFESLPDAAHGVGQFETEEGLDHDVQGEFAHLLSHVDIGPVSPPALVLQREVHHDLRVFRDAAAVELGLHQTTLPQVERTVGGDQAVAQQVAEGFGEPAASDALVVRHEQFPDQVGVVDEVHEDGLDRHGHQVAVTGCFFDQAQGVCQIAEGLPNDGQLGRTWRQRLPVNLGMWRVLNGGGSHGHGESSRGAARRKVGCFRLCHFGFYAAMRLARPDICGGVLPPKRSQPAFRPDVKWLEVQRLALCPVLGKRPR